MQLLESVVPVDDPTIKVVQVGGGKSTAIERNERAQIRRNHRNHVQDHPLRLVARVRRSPDVRRASTTLSLFSFFFLRC